MLVNQEDPVKAQLVDERISTLLAQANLAIARRIAVEGGNYLDLMINGGKFEVVGQSIHILGLRASAQILEALGPALPAGPLRSALRQVTEFTSGARDNLDIAGPLIKRLAQPIVVKKEVVNGSAAAAGNLRDRGRGDADAGLRHGAAGRRVAGARARGERLPAADPGPGLARRRCSARRCCWGWPWGWW